MMKVPTILSFSSLLLAAAMILNGCAPTAEQNVSPEVSHQDSSSSSQSVSASSSTPSGSNTEEAVFTDLTSLVLSQEFPSLEQIALTPDGDKILLLTAGGEKSRLVSLELSSQKETVITEHSRILRMDCWNDEVYLLTEDSVIKQNLETGEKWTFPTAEDVSLPSARISGDGAFLAVPGKGLRLIPLEGNGEPVTLLPGESRNVTLVRPLEEGLFAVALRGEEGEKYTCVVNSQGEILFQGQLNGSYPTVWQEGILVSQDQETQGDGAVALVNLEAGQVKEFTLKNRGEENAAAISADGRWILTGLFEDSSGILWVNLYDTDKGQSWHYTLPSSLFQGTPNLVGGGDSLLLTNDGVGFLRLLDSEGYRLVQVDFPQEKGMGEQVLVKELNQELFFPS